MSTIPSDPLLARLPPEIRSRIIPAVNGLDVHILEAGLPDRPLVLLLHGFPELAFSWRAVMEPLAQAGFYVVAPDLRGYGRTTGWDGRFDGNWRSFAFLAILRDVLALTFALEKPSVAAVVGHDFGAPVASYAALVRPDVFRAVALMSGPFAGAPSLPFGIAGPRARRGGSPIAADSDLHAALAALDPPRRHYTHYFSSRQADYDMRYCPEGLHAFLRAYFHMKSADWPANRPVALPGATAQAMAALPTYYVMALGRTMPETVAPEMPSPEAIAACRWLPEADLAVYAHEYARTGFQGGLNWYRCMTDAAVTAELQLFAGRTIDVPALFVSGAADWAVHQIPGLLKRMREGACRDLRGVHLLEGAGHWVQQEQAARVSALLVDFLRAL